MEFAIDDRAATHLADLSPRIDNIPVLRAGQSNSDVPAALNGDE